MGKVQKFGACVLHALSEDYENQQVTISAGLLARHCSSLGHKQQYLYQIITGDEKWCLYIKTKQGMA